MINIDTQKMNDFEHIDLCWFAKQNYKAIPFGSHLRDSNTVAFKELPGQLESP